MNSVTNSVQRGTPDAAPLLKIQGAGPRINVSGYRKPDYGTPSQTVKPQADPKKAAAPGVGRLIDVTA